MVATPEADYAVLTLALGKRLYAELALNLARSFLWWHEGSGIPFYLATDLCGGMPEDLAAVRRIPIKPGEFGEGFSPKLHLDKIAPARHTLFIDADCLCVGNLQSVFSRFHGRPVGVVGGTISEGEWFGDVALVCRTLGVAALPKFNGGLYYLEPGEACERVYCRARELEAKYDALGLKRLRGQPNDELLIAMAMAENELSALGDDGSILSDPQACPGPLSLDVFRGRSRLVNPAPGDPLHRSWYPFKTVAPVLVHFLGDAHQGYQYRSEAFRLRYWSRGAVARLLSGWYAAVGIRLPAEPGSR